MSKKHLISSVDDDSGELLLWDSSISSIFRNISTFTVAQTQLNCPIPLNRLIGSYGNNLEICSCNGILCFTFAGCSSFLWKPSLRRYNILPPSSPSSYSIGYDNFNDVYKVVAVSFFMDKKKEVNVHTLGTNYLKRIQDFPYSLSIPGPGVFVSGTINWSIYDVSDAIVSLLEKESYKKISLLHLKKDYWTWTLGVFRDCLCIFARSNMFLDIWIMKEYGNIESWTILYSVPVPIMGRCVPISRLYIFLRMIKC